MKLRQGSEKNDGFHRVRILFSCEIRFSDSYSTKKNVCDISFFNQPVHIVDSYTSHAIHPSPFPY